MRQYAGFTQRQRTCCRSGERYAKAARPALDGLEEDFLEHYAAT